MKIGILVQDITFLGGVETVSFWLSEYLKTGNNVDIISCKKHNEVPYITQSKTNIEYLSISIGNKKFTKTDFNKIQLFLANKKYDCIILQLSTVFRNLCFIANLKLLKIISKYSKLYLCIHLSPKSFLIRHNTNQDSNLKFFIKKIYTAVRYKTEAKYFFYRAKKYVTTFITLSKGCKSEFEKYYGLNSVICYNPFPFNPDVDVKEKENVVLWAGRLSPEKNVQLLLNAWNELDCTDSWKLKIVGSGVQEPFLRNIIAKKKIRNVELIPSMLHDKLMIEFQKSKIYVLTSFVEGFPTVVSEAMNYHNAVLSTRYDGFSDELIIDSITGYIINYDSRNLCEKLKLLMTDSVLLETLQNRAYNNALAFHTKHIHDYDFIFQG